jgi:hypothetical protein
MPAANAKKPEVYCPQCYLESSAKVVLNQDGFVSVCGRGHRFEDREALSDLMMDALQKMRANRKPQAPPQPTEEEIRNAADLTVIDRSEGGNGSLRASEIAINAVDFSRMASIVGHFTDSASLFGAIHALNQELENTKELLQRAETSRKIGDIHKLGGDLAMEIVIPEQWVTPIRELAEANGLTLERYMAGMMEYALERGWFV